VYQSPENGKGIMLKILSYIIIIVGSVGITIVMGQVTGWKLILGLPIAACFGALVAFGEDWITRRRELRK
jgi:hypothetical protein